MIFTCFFDPVIFLVFSASIGTAMIAVNQLVLLVMLIQFLNALYHTVIISRIVSTYQINCQIF